MLCITLIIVCQHPFVTCCLDLWPSVDLSAGVLFARIILVPVQTGRWGISVFCEETWANFAYLSEVFALSICWLVCCFASCMLARLLCSHTCVVVTIPVLPLVRLRYTNIFVVPTKPRRLYVINTGVCISGERSHLSHLRDRCNCMSEVSHGIFLSIEISLILLNFLSLMRHFP